jgi:tRNA pseudouridine55 synthase
VARARRGEPVDGVLLLDKSSGITSNLALQKARRLLAAAKAGHTGTLDPLASGLLPLAFGEATKFASDLLDATKAYEAEILLGASTRTGDAEGEVIATAPVDVTPARLESALVRLTGSIEQVPPMFSALKRDGVPLYEYARAGVEVERAARAVTIHRLELRAFDGRRARLVVECSKGTYVRVFAQDIGRLLGCGAHLTALRRTQVGELSLAGSVTLEALAALELPARRARLLPLDALMGKLPRVELDASLADRFSHGQRLPLGPGNPCGRVRVVGPHARLLGIAQIDEHGLLAPRRLVQPTTTQDEDENRT